MKVNQISVDNYRQDRLYPKVVLATARVLMESDEVSPVTILLKMGNLTLDGYHGWRRGCIPYLERVFHGSLPKASRILRIIGFHVHDLKMVLYQHEYKQNGKNKLLKFSKSNEANIEKRYCRHYTWNRSPEKKQEIIDQGLSYSEATRRK
jgi:hypothetical protein